MLIVLLNSSCTHEPEEIAFVQTPENNDDDPANGDDPQNNEEGNCDPDTVYFVNHIQPLLNSSCGTSGCHDAVSQQDGVRLTDYSSVVQTGKIKAYDPADSELYEVITETEPDDRMPPNPYNALTADQIEMIRKWIAQGALNNQCTELCDTVNITFSGTVQPVIEANCKGCHSGANPSGGVFLETYNDIKTNAQNGKLMGTINHEAGYSPMPQNGEQLSHCNQRAIEKWIEDGMPDN